MPSGSSSIRLNLKIETAMESPDKKRNNMSDRFFDFEPGMLRYHDGEGIIVDAPTVVMDEEPRKGFFGPLLDRLFGRKKYPAIVLTKKQREELTAMLDAATPHVRACAVSSEEVMEAALRLAMIGREVNKEDIAATE